MNRIIAIVAAVIVVLLAGWYLLAHSKSSTSNDTASMTMSPATSPSGQSTTSASPAAATNAVTIQNFAFSPATLAVKTGTTVTWTNRDSANHTVTENDSQPGPSSGSLSNGQTYSYTFSKAGTYKYFCSIHPNMTATVTVTD
jgi:plastocyanin